MKFLCRLCLSIDSENVHNLFENSIMMMKVATCMKVELKKIDCLPDKICLQCIEKVEDVYNFHKKVAENQNTLYTRMKNGPKALNLFYSTVKKLKDNKLVVAEDTNVNIVDEEKALILYTDEQIEENNIGDMKVEHLDDNFNYTDNDSENDDMSFEQITTNSEFSIKKEKAIKNKTIKREEAKGTTLSADDTDNEGLIKVNSHEFKCLTCFETYELRKDLLRHYEVAHKPEITDEIENIHDFVIKEGLNRYKCGKCVNSNKVYATKNRVVSHLDLCHRQSRPYICNLCGRTYKIIHDIVRHIRAHSDKNLHCSYDCGYSTAYTSALRAHEASHRDEFKYKCEKCGKGFQVKTWYDEHQNVHNGVTPYECDVCGMKFHMKRQFNKHRPRAHPEAPSVDTVVKQKIICLSCSRPFDSKNSLNRHMLLHHGASSPLLCDICGKSFKSSGHLNGHRKIHTKPYACGICSRTFASRDHRKRHQVTHTGERAYICDECGKRYSQRSSLKKHIIRTHMTHKCLKCNKKFMRSVLLAKHQKTCLGD